MSIVSGTVGAIMGANAQDKATKTNRKNAKETNELNYKMWRESRGEGGSAVMPLYLTRNGTPFEKELGEKFMTDWDELTTSYSPERFEGAVGQTAAARSGARQAVNDLYSGATQGRMLDNFQPVKTARVAFRRQAAMDALNRTLNEISELQAAKGFSGDSMGNRILALRANKQAADDLGMVNLQNVEEERAIRDAMLQSQLANVQVPYQIAESDARVFALPQDSYIDTVMKGLQPMSFLRVGGAQPFQYQPMPTVTPSTSPWQPLAQAGAATGNMALNYWLNKQQQAAWAKAAEQQQVNMPPSTSGQWNGVALRALGGGGGGGGAAAAKGFDPELYAAGGMA